MLNGIALYIAYCTVLIGNNVLNYVSDPWLLAGIPVFPVLNGFLYLIYGVQRFVTVLEHSWGLRSLQVLGGLLCAIEMVQPGAILGLPEAVAKRLRPRTTSPKKPDMKPKQQKILLTMLLVVLAIIVWRRFQEGLLTPDTLYVAGGVTLRVLLPIIVVFWLLRRTRIFRTGNRLRAPFHN